MKKTLFMFTALILVSVLTLAGCAGFRASEASSELNGVRVRIASLKTEQNRNISRTVFRPSVEIENNSSENIMSVSYTLVSLDGDGNRLNTYSFTWNGQDTPLKPGEKTVHEQGFQDETDDRAETMAIEISDFKTDIDVPPVHLPQQGERLCDAVGGEKLHRITDELPVSLTVIQDRGGERMIADVTDHEKISRLVELFAEIRIGEETGEMVTDNYNSISFTFADGTEEHISINLRSLELWVYGNPHVYGLENLSEFWQAAMEYAEYE